MTYSVKEIFYTPRIKQVYPQAEPEAQLERFVHLDFQYFLLQPLYGPPLQENTQAA